MAAITYLDFDLLIKGSEAGYCVRVLNSPAGQAASYFTLPFSELELENFLLRVGQPRRGVRRWGSSQMKEVRAFGGCLFSAVFGGEVGKCLHSSLGEANRQGVGLRIRLRLTDVPELVDLPWEYLYNANLNRFLSLSAKSPIVRYPDLPERVLPLAVRPPLKVLVMISSPDDHPLLDVGREWAKLKDALSDLERRGLVALERLERATLAALQQRLRREAYHIFHFIGHGGFDEQVQGAVLIMVNGQGRGSPVNGQRLGTLLHDHSPPLRLAILNACEGGRASRSDPFAGTAQSLVQQGIPAVIAMQFEITDQAATTLTYEFYSALSDGYPIDAALAEARKAIFAQGNDVEWGTPVLYMRSQDGWLFNIERVPGLEPLSERKKEVQDRLAKDRERLKAWEGELHRARDSEERANFEEMIRVLREDIEVSAQKIAAIEEELWQLNLARLDRLYAEAEQAEGIPDWPKAISIFQQILDIDGGYKDASQKLAKAKRKQRCLLWKARLYSIGQRVQGFWARHKTRIPVLAVLLLMVAGITFLGKPIVSILQPTPTPLAAQVSVEAFLIAEGEGTTITIKPGTTITATVEEIVGIKVEVSTASQEQEEALSFTWYSCKTGASPVLQRVGNPEMLYSAPSEPGSDCIRVVIEKGGALLDRSEIFVDVQK